MTWLPDMPDTSFPGGLARPVVPVPSMLVNVTADELTRLVALEIPFHPINNERGGVFSVENMLVVLTPEDATLRDIFEYAEREGAVYVIASVHKEDGTR